MFQRFCDHNLLLEKLDVSCKRGSKTRLSKSDVEQFNESMKHFLAGCPKLHSIVLRLRLDKLQTQANDVCISICSMLSQSLGDYNPLLEKLEVSCESRSVSSLSESHVEQFKESMKHFLVRCPQLSNLTLTLTELPSQCITTIANYALNLEKLTIYGYLKEPKRPTN